jgi:putative transposase
VRSCRSPSLYYELKARQREPARRRQDARLGEHIGRVWRENREVYGAQGLEAAPARRAQRRRCTVAQLMRQLGLAGALRSPKVKVTTIPAIDAARPADLFTR